MSPRPKHACNEFDTFAHGFHIVIETAAGETRSGVEEGGKPWSVVMPCDYGYIVGTEDRGDGSETDVFLGLDDESDRVFIVTQRDPKTGGHDEHKVMLGFDSPFEAKAIYQSAFNDGAKDRVLRFDGMTLWEFKKYWLPKNAKPTAVLAANDWPGDSEGHRVAALKGVRDISNELISLESAALVPIVRRIKAALALRGDAMKLALERIRKNLHEPPKV